MAKCQECKHLIKNCKCQRTEHRGKTCQDTESLDEHVNCTCYIDCGESQIINSCGCCSVGRMPQQDGNCCKVCGKSDDSCPGCCNACKKIHCECICSHCQQSSCRCCSNCKNYPCTCEQHCRQCKKEKDNCDCGKTCQQIATDCLCCSVCPQLICVCCKNCGEPDRGIHCPRCQAIITDCNCVPQTQTQAGTLEPITPPIMQSLKPPDMSFLRDRSQLEFYISALEKWATIGKTSGIAETLLAEIILAHAVKLRSCAKKCQIILITH